MYCKRIQVELFTVPAVMTEGLSYDGKAWRHWWLKPHSHGASPFWEDYVSGPCDGIKERIFKTGGPWEAVAGPHQFAQLLHHYHHCRGLCCCRRRREYLSCSLSGFSLKSEKLWGICRFLWGSEAVSGSCHSITPERRHLSNSAHCLLAQLNFSRCLFISSPRFLLSWNVDRFKIIHHEICQGPIFSLISVYWRIATQLSKLWSRF